MSLRLQWPCQARAAPASAPPVSDNGLARLSSPRPPPAHTYSAVLGLELKFSNFNIFYHLLHFMKLNIDILMYTLQLTRLDAFTKSCLRLRDLSHTRIQGYKVRCRRSSGAASFLGFSLQCIALVES